MKSRETVVRNNVDSDWIKVSVLSKSEITDELIEILQKMSLNEAYKYAEAHGLKIYVQQ